MIIMMEKKKSLVNSKNQKENSTNQKSKKGSFEDFCRFLMDNYTPGVSLRVHQKKWR